MSLEEIEYEDFRTGLTFADVRELLRYEQDRKYKSGEYMFVSRSTVLGRWYQIKQEMWEQYNACIR